MGTRRPSVIETSPYSRDDGIVGSPVQRDEERPPSGEPDEDRGGAGGRRRALAVMAILATLLLGAVALIWRDDGSGAANEASTELAGSSVIAKTDDPTPAGGEGETTVESGSPTTVSDSVSPPEPPQTVALEPVEPPTEVEALASVERVLTEAVNAIQPSDDGTPGSLPDLTGVVTGSMLDELEAIRAEYENEGWTQLGAPEIVSLRVVEAPTADAPDDAIVEVCLDNSGVRIVDEDGNDVREPGSLTRVLNIYVLRFIDGQWVVADHTFPDDTDC